MGSPRANAGRRPEPDSIRSAKGQGGDWILLPAEGRVGKRLPAWPLEPRATRRERELWARYWRKPQAIMWERLGMADDLAHYIRVFTEAEQPGASLAARTMYRQLGEAIGVSLPGMRMHRWKIVVEAPKLVAAGAGAGSVTPIRRSSRERFASPPEPDPDE
jgi:hypothetical protein